MTDLLSSLPGDIPGLLRPWAPIWQEWSIDDQPAEIIHGVAVEDVTEASDPDQRWLCWFTDRRVGRDNRAAMFLHLDLNDPHGRVDAAWWADAQLDRLGRERGLGSDALLELASAPEWYVCGLSQRGELMTPAQIDTLARLVLRLAGRTP